MRRERGLTRPAANKQRDVETSSDDDMVKVRLHFAAGWTKRFEYSYNKYLLAGYLQDGRSGISLRPRGPADISPKQTHLLCPFPFQFSLETMNCLCRHRIIIQRIPLGHHSINTVEYSFVDFCDRSNFCQLSGSYATKGKNKFLIKIPSNVSHRLLSTQPPCCAST